MTERARGIIGGVRWHLEGRKDGSFRVRALPGEEWIWRELKSTRLAGAKGQVPAAVFSLVYEELMRALRAQERICDKIEGLTIALGLCEEAGRRE